jgi:actin
MDLPAVLDIGSSTLKVGLAGYDQPKVVCENIIGRPRLQDIVSLTGKPEKYVGSEAQSKRAILNISYPVQKGYVKNIDDLEVPIIPKLT